MIVALVGWNKIDDKVSDLNMTNLKHYQKIVFSHIDHVVVIPFIKRRRVELSWYNRPAAWC